jgi:hypothetical protein
VLPVKVWHQPSGEKVQACTSAMHAAGSAHSADHPVSNTLTSHRASSFITSAVVRPVAFRKARTAWLVGVVGVVHDGTESAEGPLHS